MTIIRTIIALKLETFNIFEPPGPMMSHGGPVGSCDPSLEVKHEGLGTQTCLPCSGYAWYKVKPKKKIENMNRN
jgi:hypothetical protein